MKTDQQKVIDYYKHPETKLGFNFILWGSKHFGYYPNKQANISEKKAQALL